MYDPYAVLGVSPVADASMIRNAYHRHARQWDPGINPSPFARDRLRELTFAYEVLIDDARRRAFDEYGEASVRPDFDPRRYARRGRSSAVYEAKGARVDGPRADDLEDVLRSVGEAGGDLGSRGGPVRGVRRGNHQHLALPVPFMTTVLGGVVEVAIPRTGAPPERLEVSVPAGAREGGFIRVLGRGHPSPEGPPGDLLLELRVAEHPLLRRRGNDLEMDVPITLLEALQGGVITVPTPIGHAQVPIPAGASAEGRVVVVGHGVQRRSRPGNLHLVLRPTLPDERSPEDYAAAQRMEPRYRHAVRDRLRL